MKHKILLFMTVVIMMVTLATAADICEQKLTPGKECQMLTPFLSCTTFNYTIYNETDLIEQGNLTQLNSSSIYFFNFNQTGGDYIVELCDSSTREIIVEGTDQMSSVAITLFILFVAGGLFVLPFVVRRFAKSQIANLIIKRGMIVVAIYLMMLNSAIMATIAEFAGLNVTQEMFRFMWLFGMAGWITLGLLVFTTLFQVIKMWKVKTREKRFG